jgi:two-component system chemotaxis response regulator CheV
MIKTMTDIDQRTRLAGLSMFEMLLFKLGEAPGSSQRELFGINVFKVREILVMPELTVMANAPAHVMGVANVRGQMIPVINLPAIAGCNPTQGLGILLVTEFARTTQAFAVEEVSEIVRLAWKHVLSAEGTGGGLVTSLARLDGDAPDTRLAQVLDVEQILQNVFPTTHQADGAPVALPKLQLPLGSVILVADDSALARLMIEKSLSAMGVPCIMTKTGKQAWECLQSLAAQAASEGVPVRDKVALVLTDLEMPEMDGFTLTRNIKREARYQGIPVVIHSSLTGEANEAHVNSVGADAYVAKFVAEELAQTICKALAQ